ncbi:MAG: M48 family metalloprotease [Bacillota bacterium]
MTFFERQHVARRNSRLILVLFALAVVAIVLAMDLVAVVAWYFTRLYVDAPPRHTPGWLHAFAIGGTILVIVAASVKKSLELHEGGGMAIARMMGGRQIVPLNAAPLERRLLNIVEEMAIASGARVPLAYVLDDHGGINSFAAGDDGSINVIVVTRGALETLNRDELQAVITHEFSHIVNGDMALNLRMIGVLAGLLFIGAAGEWLLRVAWSADEKDIRALAFATFAGGALFCVGYTGLFFGRLIKAMVAREREFLADAGSVQFTRNPEGLAGALDQVKRVHSFVLHERSEDVSHLFFAEAIYLEDDRWLATHPRVQDRIERLVPGFSSKQYRDRRTDALAESVKTGGMMRVGDRATDAGKAWTLTPAQASALVGTVTDTHVRAATALLDALPASARAALAQPDSAGALVLGMLLAGDAAVRETQLAALREAQSGALASAADAVMPIGTGFPLAWHLPVVDLALPRLRTAAPEKRAELLRALEIAAGHDRRVSVYRFAFLTFVRAQLEARPTSRKGTQTLEALGDDVALVLSLVAYAGCADPQSVEADFPKAFKAGAAEMQLALAPVERDRCSPDAESRAIERLRDLAPLAKARLVKGLFAAITADGTIRVVEAALMRMIGAVLDCPLPPLMEEFESSGTYPELSRA